MRRLICQDLPNCPIVPSLESLPWSSWPTVRALAVTVEANPGAVAPTAAERVIAAELQSRGGECDALAMMVSSVARMVQAGRSSDNRWKAD